MSPPSSDSSSAQKVSASQKPSRRAALLAWLLVALMAPASVGAAESAKASRHPGLAEQLNFESSRPGTLPTGWFGDPAGTLFADGTVVHSGRWSARIERGPNSPEGFSVLTRSLPVDFSGRTIELKGYLRTEAVGGFAGLWMRQDGDTPNLAFDNMSSRRLKGTTGWTEYSLTLPLKAEAKLLAFGALVQGTGKVWVDDLQLLVDGKPLIDAPRKEPAKTVLDRDHEFDGGSKIALESMTDLQVRNIALLGKVWGFLKYHHPRVTAGLEHWDYALFRVMPSVLAAPDDDAARAALFRWIDSLGEVAPCTDCADLRKTDLHFGPGLDWLGNDELLGADLGQRLRSIHRNRANGAQFYIAQVLGVKNPEFRNEPAYAGLDLPDAGFQLLGLFRFWNIIEYWFPYRDVLGEDWNAVLREFVPRIALARDADAYQRELMALIGKAHDSHANLWSSLRVRPPVGDSQLPVSLRFIENQAVVSGYDVAGVGRKSGLQVGDIVTELDGVKVARLVEEWSPFYAAGNEPTRLRDIARHLFRGKTGPATVRVLRDGETLDLKAERVLAGELDLTGFGARDLRGDTFRLLSDQVAYLKLSSVKADAVAGYVEAAQKTKGLIVDIRNYPSEFVVFALGSLLVPKPTDFARFTVCDLANPGAFHWGASVSLEPAKPRYTGKVVVLVDESTQSQAEYTSMALRAAGAVIVGSTTAGADGNVSGFGLPGGLSSAISGIGVFYPDKTPTQRVGIVPDVVIRPSVAGIRAGRDEVLEEAVRQILGPAEARTVLESLPKR